MNFVDGAKIWDLHIHTNKCPKGSGEFIERYWDRTDDYLERLIEILKSSDNSKVEMISFTDHNQISVEVYESFYKRETDIKLIPGVEVDCLINEDASDAKHILFYFDCDESNIDDLGNKVNEILRGTRERNEYLKLTDLLDKMLRTGYSFILSPHAFKQGKRGIDQDWVNPSSTEKELTMLSDQFFVFWESAGHSSIQHAKTFLENFEKDQEISVVSFSDSNSFNKLKEYIVRPLHFFNSLPTFKGLALVGSDSSRIRSVVTPYDESYNPGLIKEVTFGSSKIYFSKQLNTIIGGRGSGKSILLDSIANGVMDINIDTNRKKYINKFSLSIKNYNDSEISEHFSIDYFNQSYVSTLFMDSDYSSKLKERFSEAFSSLNKFSCTDIMAQNKREFKRKKHIQPVFEMENLYSFSKSFHSLTEDTLKLNINEADKIEIINSNKSIDYADVEDQVNVFFDNIPEQIRRMENISNLKNIVKAGVFREVYEHNISILRTDYSLNMLIDTYIKTKVKHSDRFKEKQKVTEDIKKNIGMISKDIKYRNSLITSYFLISDGFKYYYSDFVDKKGMENNIFVFSKELTIETPLDYLIRIFDDYIDSRKKGCPREVSGDNLLEICLSYINGDLKEKLKDKKTFSDLTSELEEFDLDYNLKNNIYYVDSEGIKNIADQSPGTQTNILMEYIVHKNTNKPLLIDQPEDNIDNKTIYNKLSKWFSDLKNKRQVIVVTHDANIVINSDAENVIIAEQVEPGKFNYRNGALEFEDIMDQSSLILDGGKSAVKRRLEKYES